MALIQCVMVLQDHYEVDLLSMTVSDVATKHNWKSASDFLAKNGIAPSKTAKV